MLFSSKRLRACVAALLACALGAGAVRAGITVTGTDGITVTGTDGVSFVRTSGIKTAGADGPLAFGVNGITVTGTDGITTTGTDGITVTGTDGVTYAGADLLDARGVDSLSVASVDGITVTGTDGITVTGTDGVARHVDSVLIRRADGITVTGTDGITVTGTDGITSAGSDALNIARADGITVTGTDGITVTGTDGITVTGTDGRVFSVAPTAVRIAGADSVAAMGADGISLGGMDSVSFVRPDGITVTGTDGITVTGTDGITVTGTDRLAVVGTDGITVTGTDGITVTGTDGREIGLRSVDPELAVKLDRLTDDSNVSAVVVFHRQPGDADIADLRGLGVLGGTRYRALPMIAVTATRRQIVEISRLPNVRSIYGNRTLRLTADPFRAAAGAERVAADADLTRHNSGLSVTGRGVTVAVLDTGIDATHADLSGRVVRNVKLADTQSLSLGFTSPLAVEGLPNTDQLHGHGTFVGGLIAGDGARSGGAYGGVAPGASLVGLSAGDLTLLHVLSGFDYLMSRRDLGVRVVNCSFSAETVYDEHDPVNVATKMLTEAGVNVVFSAGNTGPGLHTLNPYAAAPWVVSVGATDRDGRLADFSSRGDFGSRNFRPTLVAPGVSLVSLRSSGASVVGTSGLLAADSTRLSAGELLFYTTGSGTSFSAPQVAGAIALMLEANPRLTPAEVRDILQRTATPLAPYYSHEVGAGMLNAHAAVVEAAFPARRFGMWRATLDRGQVRFVNDPARQFGGVVSPWTAYATPLDVPGGALLASVQIAWGPIYSTNDLKLALLDPRGVRRAQANALNLPGLTGRRESAAVRDPTPGAWRVSVANALSPLGTSQRFAGVLEVTRAEYAPLRDVETLSAAEREAVYQNLRSFVMWPSGDEFRPRFGVTRAELAAATVLGARVPQYVPGTPTYADVQDLSTMLFVESAQAAPGGALFDDAEAGGDFRPDELTGRLAAAVVLVRAAGLRAEAEARAGAALAVSDAASIPSELRGYAAVALERGLLAADGGLFRPQHTLTRVELARALAAIANRAAQ
jgi:serine protease AprX